MFYFRWIMMVGLSFVLANVKAQEAIQSKLALVEGVISDLNYAVKAGEIIVFENVINKIISETLSNGKGEFFIGLPYAQSYLIKIKGFSEDEVYGEFDIPALAKEQAGLTFKVDIQFEPERMFILKNVKFDTGKASLKEESYIELNLLLEFMQLKKSIMVEIAGHTDNVGEVNDNLILSQNRAESVRGFLISKGIDPKRIAAKGFGESSPTTTNDTVEGRSENRRTVVRILK